MLHFLDRIATFVSWHRRVIGAFLGATSVLLGVHIATAKPPTVDAVVIAVPVSAGQKITSSDVRIQAVPPELASGLSIDEVVDQVAASSLQPGAVLQEGMLAKAGNARPGRAMVPIVVSDAQLRSILTPGAQVSLVLVDSEAAEILTNDAFVAALPTPESTASTLSTAGSSRSTIVLMDVQAKAAPTVAALGQSGRLSIVFGAL